jgi:transcription initiation factor TFIID TATA-box-binding protein
MKEPARTTALIFKTGKMVITGAKSETLSKEAAKAYAKAIQKVGYPNVKMTEFKV